MGIIGIYMVKLKNIPDFGRIKENISTNMEWIGLFHKNLAKIWYQAHPLLMDTFETNVFLLLQNKQVMTISFFH